MRSPISSSLLTHLASATHFASKDSAMRYNYNYGDNSAVDETSAKFKQMGDDRKAEKKDAISECQPLCLYTSFEVLGIPINDLMIVPFSTVHRCKYAVQLQLW